jgi:uncharacterized protein with GYD domain
MGTYLLLMRNDARGAALMLDAGEDGASSQRRAIEAYGGQLVKQYGVMGSYDVVVIAEFPEPASCYGFALDATAGGQYTEVLPALEPTDVGRAAECYAEAYRRLDEAQRVAAPPDEEDR